MKYDPSPSPQQDLSYYEWTAVCSAGFVLICQVRQYSLLAFTSYLGVFAEIAAVAYIVQYCSNNFDVSTNIDKVMVTDWDQLPIALGISIYICAGIGVVLDMEKSMKHPKQFEPIMWAAYGVMTGLFLATGWVGYIAYGEDTDEIITLNLPQDAIATKMIAAGLMIAQFGSFPVQMFPVFAMSERWLFTPHTKHVEWKRTAMRALLAVIICFVAVAIPRFGMFMSLVGGVGSSTLSFSVPAVLYAQYYREKGNLSTLALVCSIGIVLFGAAAAVLTSYKTLINLSEGF